MSVEVTETKVHGLRLTHAVARYDESALRRGVSDEDLVRLHFSLQGQYGVHYPQLARRFDRLGPHCSIFFARRFELAFVNQSPLIETYGIAFPPSLFAEYAAGVSDDVSRFCERAMNGRASFLFEPSESLPATLEHDIRRTLTGRYEGALERLFLLSQSIDLLGRILEWRSRTVGKGAPFRLTRAERDRVLAARDFIDEKVTDPPALCDIARHVGLNEFKLKRGFKEVFETTPFSYLTGRRLELARRMLLDTDMTAAEIGVALGYTTPQHFHAAFKRRFGATPKSMRKNP